MMKINCYITYRNIYRDLPKLLITLPNCLINKIITKYHNEEMRMAHLGTHKVFNKIKNNYHWLNMLKVSYQKFQQRKPDRRPAV